MFAMHYHTWLWRSAMRASAMAAAAGLYIGLCGCQPASLRYAVASSSMAPALLGPSLQATCQHCRHVFPVAAETYRLELPTRCSKCGGHCHVANQLLPGQQIDIAPLEANQPLKRFELVAFEEPASGATHVKRVWGLPGEEVLMRDGEVYLSSPTATAPQLLQKSLNQFQQLCVPLSRFPDDSVSHWYWTAGSRVSSTDTTPLPNADSGEICGWEPHAINGAPVDSISPGPLMLTASQRLQWRFQRPAPVHTDSRRNDAVPPGQWLIPSPVVDDYEINQGVSCPLHQVDDYLLQLELLKPLAGELRIMWRRGQSLLPIVFHPGSSPYLGRQRATNADPQMPPPLRFTTSRHVVVAWCDQRLLVETDFEAVELDASAIKPAWQLNVAEGAAAADASWQLQVDASQPVQLKQILVARDLYFDDWQAATATTEGYFVMGDNLPVSIDSRGGLGRITPQQIVGRVRR